MNLPNRLTVLRVAMVPVFVAFLMQGAAWSYYVSAAIFIAASLTDLLDGMIARKNNLITNFGKFMDPIADKLLVMSALIGLCALGKVHYLIVMLSVAREFVIGGVRMVAADKGIVIAAGAIGKRKTETQMVGTAMRIFACTDALAFLWIPSEILLWISVALSVWSCVDYIRGAREVFSDGM